MLDGYEKSIITVLTLMRKRLSGYSQLVPFTFADTEF